MNIPEGFILEEAKPQYKIYTNKTKQLKLYEMADSGGWLISYQDCWVDGSYNTAQEAVDAVENEGEA